MTGTDAIRATANEILKIISARDIVGHPIETEDTIIIPITKMGMGFGTGQGKESRGNDKTTIKSEAGGGLGIIPVAVVVVFKGISGEEGVRVIPLSTPGKEPLGGIAGAAQTILEIIASSQEKKEKSYSQKSVVIE